MLFPREISHSVSGFVTCALVLLVGLPAAPALGQPGFECSGYIVNFLMVNRLRTELARWWRAERQEVVNLARVRLRPTLYLWGGARVAAEYEADGIRFASALPYFDVPENKPRQVVDLSWEPVDEKHFQVYHFVDRLYLRQDFDFGNLVVGRQRISWGTGRIWNPTDFFNPINPTAFYKLEKDGADAVSAKWYLGNFSDLQVVYNPEDHWKRRNVALRFRSNWRGTDFSLVTGKVAERGVIGGDFATSVGGAGVRGEAVYERGDEPSSCGFWKAIFGMDYQFTTKFYGLFEYHYNGQGTLDKTRYGLLFPQLLQGEILNLARNYLFVQVTYQLYPLVLLRVAHNWNLDDHSGFGLVAATVSTSDNSSVALGAQVFHGQRLTEYWYFPSAVYLQGEWYF